MFALMTPQLLPQLPPLPNNHRSCSKMSNVRYVTLVLLCASSVTLQERMQGLGPIRNPTLAKDELAMDDVEEVELEVGSDSAQTRAMSAEQADNQVVDSLMDALLDEVCNLCGPSVSSAPEQPGLCHSLSFGHAQTDSSSDSSPSSTVESTVPDASLLTASSEKLISPSFTLAWAAHATELTQPMTSCPQKGFVATATDLVPASAIASESASTGQLTLPSTGLASNRWSFLTALWGAQYLAKPGQAAVYRDHGFDSDSDTDSDDESSDESLGDSDDETWDRQVCRP